MLKNTSTQFGSVTKFLHWTIFLLFSFQYLLIWDRWSYPEDAAERTPLILTHKSVGVTLLGLGILFWIWRTINTRPAYVRSDLLSYYLSLFVHYSLLLVMVLMPLSGYLFSCAAGRAVSFWGWFDLPSLIAPNKTLLSIFATTHQFLSYFILVLVALHTLGALRHQFLLKDNVLTRMLPSFKKNQNNIESL